MLGDLVERLAQLHVVSDNANAQGSAYIAGWYGYVEKDLPRAARPSGSGPVLDPLLRPRRPRRLPGVAVGCDHRGECEAHGPKHTSDPATWWADARAERIDFTTGLLSDTLAWTNRPTFQQVMSFKGIGPGSYAGRSGREALRLHARADPGASGSAGGAGRPGRPPSLRRLPGRSTASA